MTAWGRVRQILLRQFASALASVADLRPARIFVIGCGYEYPDELDFLRSDLTFELACGRLPDTGRVLCSQPTLSRLENASALGDVIRLTHAGCVANFVYGGGAGE